MNGVAAPAAPRPMQQQSARITALTTSQLRRMLRQHGIFPLVDSTREQLVTMAHEVLAKDKLTRSELDEIGPQSWRSETSEEDSSPGRTDASPMTLAPITHLKPAVPSTDTSSGGSLNLMCLKLSIGICFGVVTLIYLVNVFSDTMVIAASADKRETDSFSFWQLFKQS